MTVCIAMLAENKKGAVLVADKMASVKGILSHQIDGQTEKIIKFTESIYVMYCGGISDANFILDNSKKNLGSKKTVEEIAQHINQEHLNYLHNVIINQNIIGRGIKNLDEFYNSKTLQLDPEVRREIDTALITHNLNSSPTFIVCGKSEDGIFKIYVLGFNPRITPIPISDTYAVIGSGENHARFSLIHSEYKLSDSTNTIKEIALEAKKKAEKDPDVGVQEDVIILK